MAHGLGLAERNRRVITSEGIERGGTLPHAGHMTSNSNTGHGPHSAIFKFDALLGVGFGLLLLLTGELIHSVSGGGLSPEVLRGVGLFLLPWGYYNWVVAKSPSVSGTALAVHVLGDSAWVLGSMWLLWRDAAQLSAWGWLLYGPQTVMVLGILVIKVVSSRVRFNRTELSN